MSCITFFYPHPLPLAALIPLWCYVICQQPPVCLAGFKNTSIGVTNYEKSSVDCGHIPVHSFAEQSELPTFD